MDLFTAEQLNDKRWNKAKFGAFFCFTVACALLAVSLLLPQPREAGGEHSFVPGAVAPNR